MTVCENDCFGAELETASVRVWQAGGELAFAVEGGLRVLDTWIRLLSLLNLFKNGFRRWWSRSTHDRGFDPVQDSRHGQPRQPEHS